ncbi:6089_t:CDS:2, partial [Diversispora eburnea]
QIGVYLVVGNSITRIEESTGNDTLVPYMMDAITVLEEIKDLTETTPNFDIEGLASIAS